MSGGFNKSAVAKLWCFHIAIIVVSNYLVQFPQNFAGYDYTWAMFTFPLVILATDLTIRLMGQGTARTVVGLAYIPAIVISVYFVGWRIGVASGTAYLVGQLLDIFVFQKIRERVMAWWAAPLVATLVSNVIDTYTFFGVAFYNSDDSFMAENWLNIATVDLGFKTIVSILVILPLYGIALSFLTKKMASKSTIRK